MVECMVFSHERFRRRRIGDGFARGLLGGGRIRPQRFLPGRWELVLSVWLRPTCGRRKCGF